MSKADTEIEVVKSEPHPGGVGRIWTFSIPVEPGPCDPS